MLSRVANSIYWMTRNLERAENVARFIDVNLNLILDYPFLSEHHQWQPLISASGDNEDFQKRFGRATEENVIHFLTFDTKNPNSIISCFTQARNNARTVRETISSEMWEHINDSYLMIKQQSRKRKIDDLQGLFADIKKASHLYVGLSEATMSHGQAWHFARLGLLLERADKTSRILDVKYYILLPSVEYLETPVDSVVWGALLKSVSALEMYRKRNHRINHKDVLEFLIFDDEFPRSISYCIEKARHSMAAIVRDMSHKPSASRELDQLSEFISNTNVEGITKNGMHEFIDTFQYNLNIVGDEIFNSFFTHKNLQKETMLTNEQ